MRGAVRRVALALLVAAPVLGAGAWMSPAAAQGTPPCAVAIDDVVLAAPTADDAIHVRAGDTVVVRGVVDRLSPVRIEVQMGPLHGADIVRPDASGRWQRTVTVGDYARFGVGLYRVVVETPTCRLEA